MKHSLNFGKLMLMCGGIAIATFMISCNGNRTKITTYNFNNPEILQEDSITAGIDSAMAILVSGIVDRDADKIFSVFSDTKGAKYIKNGVIFPSIKKVHEEYAIAFEHSDPSVQRLFRFKSKHYDVFSDSKVLFTGVGVIEKKNPSQDDKPWEIAYTIMWIRENGSWKVINMHVSWDS